MHRRRRTCEQVQAEALQVGVQVLILRQSVAALTATAKVPAKSLLDEIVKTMKHAAGMTVAKVPLPTTQRQIQSADHGRQRHSTPTAVGLSPDTVPQAMLGFLRGLYPQITVRATTQVAFVTEREAQEVQAGLGLVHPHHARLSTIDRQPEAIFEGGLDPLPKRASLAACQHNEVIRVADKFRVGPRAGSVRTVEQHLEPVQVDVRQQRGDRSSNKSAKLSPCQQC